MRTLLVAGLLGLAALPASADRLRPPPSAAYKAECGTCHVPYPPQLLPAESWRQLMGRLERHFGGDASIDAKAHAEIGGYLAANAGRRPAPAAAEPRITQTRWFRKEHDDLAASVWTRPAVKSAANCAACHTRAEEGDYSERTIRIPK